MIGEASMNRAKKSFLYIMLGFIGVSSLAYAQETKPKKPFFSLEQKRLMKKASNTALFMSGAALGLFGLYLASTGYQPLYQPSNATSDRIALRATPSFHHLVKTGCIAFTMFYLWAAYYELFCVDKREAKLSQQKHDAIKPSIN